ncbi:replication initiation protein [Clostridium sp. SHJSY1]|uniref:replication initiation protein n=1 Tax=Clostridium sp. SHJSY1 TaxID=2942483 RepID=UPI002875B23D|nr:replication initiation protein [Clostridium sp. SHJSY1]MDS0527125.1 replication initiation protein [Clostridium sp. SHJSY1]
MMKCVSLDDQIKKYLFNSEFKLSLEERKIIVALASMVTEADEDSKEYVFSVDEFTSLIGMKDERKYSELSKVTKGLIGKVFEIEDDDTLTQLSWISSAMYKTDGKDVEEVILSFSPLLKPYMLNIHTLFEKYKLDYI